MKASIRRLFLGLAVLGLAASTNAQTTTRVTFHVKCGSQGILDAPYAFKLEFKDPCDPLVTHRIWVDLPNRASSEAITGALEAQINQKIRDCNGVPKASTEEVDKGGGRNGEPTEDDKLKKHVLVIPKGIGEVKISAFREGSDGPGGQLEVTEEQRS